MAEVKVTELRQHLPEYLVRVRKGEELRVTLHGRVIARIVPERDEREAARERLVALRAAAKIGDVVSPVDEAWEAEHGRS